MSIAQENINTAEDTLEQLKVDAEKLKDKHQNLEIMILCPLTPLLLNHIPEENLVSLIWEYESRKYCNQCECMVPKRIPKCVCQQVMEPMWIGHLYWGPELSESDQEIWDYVYLKYKKTTTPKEGGYDIFVECYTSALHRIVGSNSLYTFEMWCK